jgi:hypothetical protein
MTVVAIELLPRDAELARRAAGGDGAAFVRLFDRYSTDVFDAAFTATRSVEAAAEATQTAFLRILRWPPPLGAPDGEVFELLCALALGGETPRGEAGSEAPDAYGIAQLVGVGWLRSETVAKAGARFDDDWSVHLWSPPAEVTPDPLPPLRTPKPARRRLRLVPRLRLRLPSPAAAATVLLVLLAGLTGSLVLQGGTERMDAVPASATSERSDAERAGQQARADARRARQARSSRFGEAKLLHRKTLEPLLAP